MAEECAYMTSVYRLAKQADWESAKASGTGEYKGGQLDFDSGFVHLSTGAPFLSLPGMSLFRAVSFTQF